VDERLPYGIGAAHGASGSIEGREESVAGGRHFSTAVPPKERANHLVVSFKELLPCRVAHSGGVFG